MMSKRLQSADRAPSAIAIGIGFVSERRLTFNKVGSDGSGKCDAEATENEQDNVYGVLFDIAASDKSQLDHAEGLGRGYREESIEIVTTTGLRRPFTYIATQKDPALQPYHWYKALVIEGAIEHNLPRLYIEWLKTFDSKADPNTERSAKHESFILDKSLTKK